VEQRKARRFALQLPLAVTRAGTERVAQLCRTRNISSSGVLFAASEQVPAGPIEYTVTLNMLDELAVTIRCVGKVIRLERMPEDDSVYVAATLERYEFVRQGDGL
jgi:hypothetical protein